MANVIKRLLKVDVYSAHVTLRAGTIVWAAAIIEPGYHLRDDGSIATLITISDESGNTIFGVNVNKLMEVIPSDGPIYKPAPVTVGKGPWPSC